jgi:hypothetical protein
MQERNDYKSNIFYLGEKEGDLELTQLFNSSFEKLEELKDRDIPRIDLNSLSIRTVKKFVITRPGEIGGKLTPDDMIEIVDYDPVRDSALALGSKNTPEDIPVHWLIYRAFEHVNGIANLNLKLDDDTLKQLEISVLDRQLKVLKPDSVMGILPQLAESKSIYLHDRGLLFYGNSFPGVIDDIISFLIRLDEHNKTRS